MKEQTNSLWFSFYSLNPFQGINKWIADCVSSLTSIEKRKAKSLQGQKTHKCKNIVVATLWCVFTEKVNQKREGKILNMLVVPFFTFLHVSHGFQVKLFSWDLQFLVLKTLLLKASNNRPISQSWTWYGSRAQNQKGFHVILLGEQLSTWRLFGKEVLPHFFALPRLLDSLRLGRLDGDNLFCQSGVKITSFFLLFLQTFLALSNNRIEQNGGNIDMIRLKRQHCCTTTTIQDGLSLDPREISCPSSTMSSFFIQKISDWSWKHWLLSKTRFDSNFSKKLKETFVCYCLVVY